MARPPEPVLQGIVSRMKDSFGFIEGMEGGQDVFFHYSEVRGSVDQLQPGDEVE